MGLETLGILSFIGMATSSAISASVSSSNQQKQLAGQSKLMNQQAELNQKQWNEQFEKTNEYNSPANQIALKQAAGLNPLYDNGFVDASPSIQGGVGLGDVGQPFTPDFAGAFSSAINSLIQFKQQEMNQPLISSEVEKNRSETEKNNSYVVNTTKQTESELAVNSAKIEELLSQKDLNDEQRNFVVQQTAASKECLKQRWEELRIMNEDLGAKLRDVSVKEYNSRWEEQVAKQNAATNYMDAVTRKAQYDLAEQNFKFQKDYSNRNYNLEVKKFSNLVTNQRIDQFVKLLNESDNSWNLGIYKSNSTNWVRIRNLSAGLEAFVTNMDKLDDKSFNKAAPVVYQLMGGLQKAGMSVSVKSAMSNNNKSYNPTPFIPDEF